MSNEVNVVRLPEKPCVIKHLEEFDEFLVGTYEQIDQDELKIKLPELSDASEACLKDKLDSLNDRFGSLAIIRRNNNHPAIFQTNHSIPCTSGGGVFDACTYYKKHDSSYMIYVAHANGVFGSYVYNQAGGMKPLAVHRLDGSRMLTSIDYMPYGETVGKEQQDCLSEKKSFKDGILVVGDSEGRIVVLNNDGIIRTTLNVTPNKDPVWQVKFVTIKDEAKCFVIVATEDASWLLLEYNHTSNNLIQMYKNSKRDFSAGITSISILASPPVVEKGDTLVTPNDNQSCDKSKCVELKLLLGSYDETIKLYSLSFSRQSDGDKSSQEARISLKVVRMGETSIAGGGIWRINCFRNKNSDNDCTKWDLYIAAMYAGSYLIRLNVFHQADSIDGAITGSFTFEAEKKLNFDTTNMGLDKDPLHYGVDLLNDKSFYCIADFNNNLCYLARNNLEDE